MTIVITVAVEPNADSVEGRNELINLDSELKLGAEPV